MSALQRSEALLRARLLDIRSYTVELDLTRGEQVFGSTTVIRFGCAEPGADTFVDLAAAELRRARLNGRPLEPAAFEGDRIRLTGLAAENELLVEAELSYSNTGEGLHRFTDPADGAGYVYATLGPDLAPRLFACFDQPDLKAPFTVTVTAPADWQVVANGALAEARDGRWEFLPTEPVSTYLVTVVAGPLHSVYAEHDGIGLALHARRSLAAELDREAGELFEVTRDSLDRLHGLFDRRYPFGQYHQAFVPEFNWGAMENPGCVVLRDELLFRSAPTDADRELRAMIVCHEMAHMWFGDLVTMRWWDDLWLNESFAEMLGYRVAAESTRFTDAWTGFAARRKGWGYDADQRASTHPVAGNGTGSVAEAMGNFDGISYAKGASALRQLVVWLGDEAFFAGINAYFAEHAFGNAELADFLAALAEAGGRDVRAWADAWLRTSGVDTLRVEVRYQGDRVAGAAVVNEGTRPHRIRLGVYDLAGPAVVRRASIPLDVAPGGRTEVPGLAGAARPALLLPNDGDLSWTKIRLDPDSWRTVTGWLSGIDDGLTRAVLWEHARDLVRDGELAPGAYLRLVAGHLPAETTVAAVEAVLAFARTDAVGRYLPPAERPAALAVLGGAAEALLTRPGAGHGLRLAALRGGVESADSPADLARLRSWLDGAQLPEGLDLSPDLRWSALATLAAKGAADEAAIEAELARDRSDIAEQGAARARAALPDPAAKERAWAALFGDGLSNRLLAATAEGFWRSGPPELQEAYVRRYFEAVPAVGERGDRVAAVLGHALFPRERATPEVVAATEDCLARPEPTPGLRRALSDELDDLRRAVRVRAAAAG
ncbi:aminopeptidase N [Kitasatospora sp. MBT63]|uniref:aminopeptidase N n=1 Tax=Kitasatospora sp. MBT63 TaxID=1444768 RepID=UPI00053B9B41|nr:aminopeptidase N [Kitasatospora sp. MBT63]